MNPTEFFECQFCAKMLGRFHLVRVVFGTVVVGLCVLIFYQNLFNDPAQVSGVIRLPVEAIHETWMTLDEFVKLARANETCPVSQISSSIDVKTKIQLIDKCCGQGGGLVVIAVG